MRKLCIIWLFLAVGISSKAILPPPNNATSLSLGGASATYLNAFAIENNVAALAYTENSIQLNAANRFGLSEYSNVMLASNFNTKFATIGVSYQISPLANLTSQKAQIAVAKKLGDKVSAGVSINYHQFSSTDVYYATLNALTFNAGIYYQINEKLNAGFQFFNPNKTKLIDSPLEQIPASFRFGTDYAVGDNIKIYADALQVTDQNLDLNAGLELTKEKYVIRGGFGLNQLIALGFGWKNNQLQIEVTGSYHNQLGFSPSLNIGYAF